MCNTEFQLYERCGHPSGDLQLCPFSENYKPCSLNRVGQVLRFDELCPKCETPGSSRSEREPMGNANPDGGPSQSQASDKQTWSFREEYRDKNSLGVERVFIRYTLGRFAVIYMKESNKPRWTFEIDTRK